MRAGLAFGAQRPWIFGLLVVLTLACRSPRSVPEEGALLLQLTCATSEAKPTEIRAWVGDGRGVLWNDASLGSKQLSCPNLGTVLIRPGAFVEPLRLHITAYENKRPILDKALSVPNLTGQSSIPVVLGFPLEADSDGDGVPNVIDVCPNLHNSEQHGCGDAEVDTSPDRDASAPPDAAGGGDAGADKAGPDRWLDAAGPDVVECRAPECTPGGPCGDGILAADEACDLGTDKNTGAYGTCNPNCTQAAFCGDGVVNGPEECEVGASPPGRAKKCGADCKWETSCKGGECEKDEG